MDAISLLKTRLKNPLEWNSAGKCWCVLLMTALLHSEYLAWALYLLAYPEPALVNVAYLKLMLPWSMLVCFVSWALVIALPGLHRLVGDSVLYEYFALLFYGLTLCYAGHFTGTLSIAAGAVLAGAPVFGFIFFRTAPVLTAFLGALAVELVKSWGSTQGYWAYAPLMAGLTDAQGHLSTFWMLSMYGFALPHVFMLVAVSWYILQRWRLREAEVRYLSLTDALTGLPNRRHVMAELQLHLELSRRHGLPLAVMMIDVDHFKRINDTHGHPAGDAVLVAVAQRLRAALRQCDIVGRIGGEEFLVMLTGTPQEGACILAERCRHDLAAEPVRATVESLLKDADLALYMAKQQGRNRVRAGGFEAYAQAAGA
ncbi:MAG: integral rane sensor-containing signal transduction diguanylate cyclase [Moraxellaceae bacterium]|nr:integral rane sensor-containing signal transduction diguanylate cyclase [Moraxellaceae bacterium]